MRCPSRRWRSRSRSPACWPRTSSPTSTCRPSTARRWTATRCGPLTWRSLPAALEVIGEVRAGQWPDLTVGPGQAARIMTGAPVPPGADCRPAGREDPAARRVPGDDPLAGHGGSERGAPWLRGPGGGRRSRARPGDRPRGDRGARHRRKGPRARRAAARRRAPRHRRRDRRRVGQPRPRADPQQQRPGRGRPGATRRRAGAPPRRRPRPAGRDLGSARAPGSPPTCSSSPAASRPATTTSSSRPSWSLGATFLFTKVAVKPGAPLVFGRLGGTLVFGLPGNPVSAQVTFDLFVRPALLRMQGATRRFAAARHGRAARRRQEPLGPEEPRAGTGARRGAGASSPGRCGPWARATSPRTPGRTLSS